MVLRSSSNRSALAGASAGSMLLALLAVRHALAQPASAGTTAASPAEASPESNQLRAERLLREGVELRRQGDELTALARFREADALQSSPRSRAQLGLAEKSLRDYVRAERDLSFALAHANDPWIQSNRAVLEAARDFASGHLGSLDLVLDVEQATLLLRTGERVVLPAAEPPKLMAGEVELVLEAAGFPARRVRARIAARQTTRLEVHFRTPARDGVTPPASRPTPRVSVSTARAPAGPSTRRVLSYGAGSLALVSAGLGSYFTVRTLQLKADRDDVCPRVDCPTRRGVELDQDARSAAMVSTVCLAVTGASVAAATYLWLSDKRASANKQRAQAGSTVSLAAGVAPGVVLAQASWTR